jgi:hypothetical protein
MLLLAAVAAPRLPAPWGGRITAALRTALTAGPTATNAEGVRLAAALVRFTEHRSWGTVAYLWEPLAHLLRPPRWVLPIVGGHVATTFGWHRRDGRYRWEGALALTARPGDPVLLPTTGRVTGVGRTTVTVESAGRPRVAVTVRPLTPSSDVRRGRLLPAGWVVGHADARTLTVAMLRDGWPVNPAGPAYLDLTIGRRRR